MELYLPHPRLNFDNITRCHGCDKIATVDLGHHVTCCKKNNEFGSRTGWHNRVRDAVISIVKGAPGLDANVSCKGLLGPDIYAERVEDRNKDKETDINVQGLHPELLGVLCDVRIVHPISGTYPHDPVAHLATEEGAAVLDAEKEKYAKYAALAARRDFGFEPLCVESYGRLGHAFITFLREMAIHVVKRSMSLDTVPVLGQERNKVVKDHVGGLFRRYKRHISLVRVPEFARRVKSAYFGQARARGAPVAITSGAGNGAGAGVGSGVGPGVGAGAGNEDGERGGSERLEEVVNRNGNGEFVGVENAHVSGEGETSVECFGESMGELCLGELTLGVVSDNRGNVHTDGLVA